MDLAIILLYLCFYNRDTAILEEHFSMVTYVLFMCYSLSFRTTVLKQNAVK